MKQGEPLVHKWVISASSFIKDGINNIAVFAENMKNTEFTMLLSGSNYPYNKDHLFRVPTQTDSNANDTESHLFFGHMSLNVVQDKIPWNSALMD